jgi:hypothetical protein
MMTDPNQEYDLRRCRCCGVPWPEHDNISTCSRYRPIEVKAWVEAGAAQLRDGTASDLPPVANDATKARREVAGGAPTREWRDGRAGSGAMNGGLSDK